MAGSKVETRGRPFYVAEMPGVSKTSSRIYDDFYEVMRNINYREIAALARSLGMARGSVSNWKYCGYTPRLDICVDIIDWYKAGKPMNLVYQRDKRQPHVM